MSQREHSRADGGARADVPAFFLYGEPLRAPDARTVHVETIAARSRLHDWKIRPHRHRDLHQVLIVWRGPIEAQLDGEHAALRGPALVIVPPLAVHSFQFGPHTDGIVVSFAAGLATEIFRDTQGLGEILNRPYTAPIERARLAATDLRQLAAMLLREFSRSASGRDSALQGLLTTLLSNVVRVCGSLAGSPAASVNRERELVARFREAVERCYRTHLDLCGYAREVGTTEAALRKACVRVAGQTPTQLLHARTLIEAERQLRYTGMTIAQIAYGLGFEDPAYFSRFFAKATGSSPRNYRRRAGTS
ncbi:MAG: helix-turn-helix domain-containing protein [Steroidobacteraceae bacterium]